MDSFSRVATLFCPIVAPPGHSLPPFSPSHTHTASVCMDRMVQLFNALPYNSVLPAGKFLLHFPTNVDQAAVIILYSLSYFTGEQNSQSLIWQLFCEKLVKLNVGTGHYFSVLVGFPHVCHLAESIIYLSSYF